MKAVLLRQLNESQTYDNELYMHQVFLNALQNTPLLTVDPHLLKISTIPPNPFIMGVRFIRKHQSLPRTSLLLILGCFSLSLRRELKQNLIPPGLLTRKFFFTDFKRRSAKTLRTTSLYFFYHNRLTYET